MLKLFNRQGVSQITANKDVQRFLKFAVVGVCGTFVDFAVLTLLVKVFGVPLIAANTISYSAGVVNNFVLNRFWTFTESRSKPLVTQFLQFVVINIIALVLSDLIVGAVEGALHPTLGGNAYLAAKLLATVIVFFWNYFANRFWTYNDVDRVSVPE